MRSVRKASDVGQQRVEEEQRTTLVETVTRLLPRLHRLGTRNQLDGDDFAQEACMRLLRIDAPDAVEQPAHYVSSVARNLLIDRHRARVRDAGLLVSGFDLQAVADPTADPEQILAGKQELALVLAAIEQLPPRCGQAFCLHRFEGLTYVAIARRMGISISSVEKHVSEALRRLDALLSRESSDG